MNRAEETVEKSKSKNKNNVSRRHLFQLIFLGAAAATNELFIKPKLRPLIRESNGLVTPESLESNENIDETIIETIKNSLIYLKNTYDLEIFNGKDKILSFLTAGFVGDGIDISMPDLRDSLFLISQEAAKYPQDFFVKNNIKGVRLSNNMKWFDEPIYGLAASLTDITLEFNRDDLHSFKCTFHHEIFHLLTYRFKSIDDYFEYRKNFNSGAKASPERKQGTFEDMPELAEQIMIYESHKRFLERIDQENDPKIKEALKNEYEIVKQVYFDMSGGLMNDQFWQDLVDNKFTPDYFVL
ncbi:hypothetical protein KA111_01520 [Candidatus Woesebacteria bacterium]|nr:hypothetical protein [Candidatus Woesebacteria bacterium]